MNNLRLKIQKIALLFFVFQLFVGCGEETKEESVSVEVNSKKSYFNDENIVINFKNMLGDDDDWIAVYKRGSEIDFDSIIIREYLNGTKNGTISFNNLPIGSYEIRAFFKDTFKIEATAYFNVISKNNNVDEGNNQDENEIVNEEEEQPINNSQEIIYEDAENGISSEWKSVSGQYHPVRVADGFNSKGAIALSPEWIDDYTNLAEYHLAMNSTTHKILEMDIGGLKNYRLPNTDKRGHIQHFSVGVYVTTTNGNRAMLWDSFFNHGNVKAFSNGTWLSYPSPVEHVRGFIDVGGLPTDKWVHFKVNIEKALQELEPENKIISIDTFFATGGFLDNLKLSR